MALTKIPANMLSGVDLGDSVRVNIGSDNDLALFHTGSNGVIHNATGELRIRANTLKLQDYSNEDLMIVANSNSSVDLYHNNQKKFETSATGATVTGNLAVTGDLDITGNVNSYNVTDLDVTDQTITLGAGQTEANSGGSGIIIDGSSASILWDETNDTFDINKGLTALGNVGIGTNSPDSILHIEGSGVASLRFDNIGPSSNSALRISRDDTSISGNPLGYLEFGGKDNTGNVDTAHAYIGAIAGSHSAGSNPTNLTFGTTPSGSSTIAEVMRIDSSGNIGIGTSSPNSYTNFTTLTLDGTTGSEIDLEAGATKRGALYAIATEVGLQTSSSTNLPLTLGTNGTEKMRISSSGNVGIGTSSPTDKLHVGANSGGTQLKIQSAASNNNCILHTNGTTDSWRTGMNLALTNGSYEFYDDVNNVSRMVLDTSGNVGIGGNPDSSGRLLVTNGGTNQIVLKGASGTTNLNIGNFVGGGYISNNYYYSSGHQVDDSSKGAFEVFIGDSNYGINYHAAGAAGTRRRDFAITNTGNVGIGTNIPSEMLHINNTSGTGCFIRFQNTGGSGVYIGGRSEVMEMYTNGSEKMRIQSNGNVGIGTNSPSYKLDIEGTSNDLTPLIRGTATNTPSGGFNWATEFIAANLANDKRLTHIWGKTRTTYGMAHVSYLPKSTASESYLALGLWGANDLLNVLGNGNVGIGTTSPGAKLEISGKDDAGAGDLLRLQFDNSPADTGITFTDINASVKNRISMDSGNTNDLRISAGTQIHLYGGTSNGTGDGHLKINSSGHIAMPNQPAFCVYNPPGTYPTAGGSKSFGKNDGTDGNYSTYMNVGSHFSTTTGRFTAPVAGNYYFSFSAMFDSSGNAGFDFKINDVAKNGGEGLDSSADTYTQIAGSILFALSANDYVTLTIRGRRIHQRYGSFEGFLVG